MNLVYLAAIHEGYKEGNEPQREAYKLTDDQATRPTLEVPPFKSIPGDGDIPRKGRVHVPPT